MDKLPMRCLSPSAGRNWSVDKANRKRTNRDLKESYCLLRVQTGESSWDRREGSAGQTPDQPGATARAPSEKRASSTPAPQQDFELP